MKKKKVSLAILGVASLFATTFASAETKTFWQCMPLKDCPTGQRQEGLECKACESNWWCAGTKQINKQEKKTKDEVLNFVKTNSQYLDKIKSACVERAKTIANTLSYSYAYQDIINMQVKIGYLDLADIGENSGPFVKLKRSSTWTTPDSKTTVSISNDKSHLYFDFNCMDVAATEVVNAVNELWANGISNDKFSSYSSIALDFHDATSAGTFNDTITENGIYVLRLYGAGGGAGGGVSANGKKGNGGCGDQGAITTVAVLVYNDTLTLKYVLGNGGCGGGDAGDGWGITGDTGGTGATSTLTYSLTNFSRNISAAGGAGGTGAKSKKSNGYISNGTGGGDENCTAAYVIESGHKCQTDRSCANATGDYEGKPKQWTCIPSYVGGEGRDGNDGYGGGRGNFNVIKLPNALK